MTGKLRVEAAGRTHVGRVRRRNEDAFYQGRSLYAVADGLGGHVAGDIASATAIEAVKACDRQLPGQDLAHALGTAVKAADTALRRRIRDEPALAGMGTTMVAMLRSGDTAVLANVGDSRAYLMRKFTADHGRLVQLSEDHTYRHLVAEAGDVPGLSEKLARFLDGRSEGRSPDLTPLQLHPGDRYLLCSDGLSSYVPEDQIRAAINTVDSPASVAQALVASALDHGGQDNVTVVVIDIELSHDEGGAQYALRPC